MDSILKNLRMKIIAWVLAVSALVMIGIFVEEKAEGSIKHNEQAEVGIGEHNLDNILKDF